MGLCLLWPLHEILRRMAGLGAARWGTLLFVFHDASYFYEITLLREFLLSFLYIWLVHHALAFLETGSLRRAAVTGVFIGLSWTAKANFMAMGPALILLALILRPVSMDRVRWWGRVGLMALVTAGVVGLPVMRNAILRQREKEEKMVQGQWKGEYALPLLKIETRGPYEYVNGNSYHAGDKGPSFESPGSTQGIGWDFNALKDLHYKTLFYSPDSPFARRVLQKGPGDETWKLDQGELLPVMRMVWAEHSERGSWLSTFWPMQWNKTLAYVNGAETPNNTNLNIHRRYARCFGGWGPVRPLFLSETLVCAVFILGSILLLGHWRRPDVLFVQSFNVMYLAITVAFYYLSRFRYPCVPLMWVAGVVGVAMIRGFPQMTTARKVLLTVLAVGSLGVAWPRDVRGGVYQENFERYEGIRLADYYNYALAKWVLQKPAEALAIVNDGIKAPYGLFNHHLIKTKIWALSCLPEEKDEVTTMVEGLWDRCGEGRLADNYPREHVGHFVGLWSFLIDRAYEISRERGDRRGMQRYAREVAILHKLVPRDHLAKVRGDFLGAGNAQPLDPSTMAAESGL
ncbi:MAG: hypothetical protein AB7F75_07810, partial [Planctomycetota bacterium]